MEILYVTQLFYPEMTAGATRAYENAKLFTMAGNDVTVLTTFPNYPKGEIYDGYKVQLLAEEYIDGVHVLRSFVSAKPMTSKVRRLIMYLSFPIGALANIFIFNRRKFNGNYDVILATTGPLFAPVIGMLLAKAKKLPFVLEIRDLTYKQILATNFSNKGIGYSVIRWLELYLCKKADLIVTVTNGFKDDLIEEGIDKDKIAVIPNGIEVGKLKRDQDFVGEELAYSGSSEEIVISYFGTIGVSQELSLVVDIARIIQQSNTKIRFLFIGEGADKERLITYAKERKVNNIAFLSGMPEKELERYYNISDYCLVVLKNNKFFKNTIPSKVFQIMGRKKPVIFIGPDGEASKIVEDAKAGKCFHNTDDIELLSKDIIDFVYSNIDMKDILGQNGYRYVLEHYNRETLCKRYIELLKDNKMWEKRSHAINE
jgi:glycosyltransferase involved in cell wall biosynthesis